MASDLEIPAPHPERLPDLASLFEQGGDPKWCWCASFRVRGMDFTKARPADNRAVLEKAARTDARKGRAPGLIAYRDGEAIGWVSLAPREDFERLEHSKVLARVDEKPVWSIVCFVVGRRARGQGVANALLAAAIDYARDHGATLLEAYPTDTSTGSHRVGQRLHGHALDVRARRLHGGRATAGERLRAPAPDRSARDPPAANRLAGEELSVQVGQVTLGIGVEVVRRDRQGMNGRSGSITFGADAAKWRTASPIGLSDPSAR